MVNLDKAMLAAAASEDVLNLLEHIAWTETILPELLKAKAYYETQLVQSVLGTRAHLQNGDVMTTEQLAGRAYGIQFVTDLMTNIVARGEKALAVLQSNGFTN